MVLKVKKLTASAILPTYSGPREAGLDFYSDETIQLLPHERKIISTGIALAIPENHVGLIWDRSGLAAKNGLKTMGGVIDATYRGEVKIIMYNLSNEPFTIENGMRIAQMIIQPITQKQIVEVEELEQTERNEKGFGSSGLM